MTMLASKYLRLLGLGFLLLCAQPALARDAVPAKPMTLSFGGVQYVHRWSQKGQNEFTPPAEADLSKWRDMLTVNVHEQVADGEQLAALANSVLGNYQGNGSILRTNSTPRTSGREAEHLVVAVLTAPGVMEAAFARVVLVEGRGVVLVYSHRAYGQDPGAAMAGWLKANGQSAESKLMAWNGLPGLAAIRALPQAK